MKPVSTNASGKPVLIFAPCDGIPTAVLKEQQLDTLPVGAITRSNRDGFESKACIYRAESRRYEVEVVAANDSTASEGIAIRRRSQALSIAGRKAKWFDVTIPDREVECSIDITATTGIYEVRVIPKGPDYGQYGKCFSVVDHYAQAFVRFFPL